MNRCSIFLLFLSFILVYPLALAAMDWPDTRAVESVTRQRAAQILDDNVFDQWSVFASSNLSYPVLAFGTPVPVNSNDPAGDALRLLQSATGSRAQFDLLSVHTTGNLTRVMYRELYENLPVICGRADIVLNARGHVMRWSLRDYSDWPSASRHTLPLTLAAASVLRHLESGEWRIDDSFPAWFPDHDQHTLVPVYWVWFAGVEPHQRWQAIVSAVNGEILLEWSGIATDVISGTIRGAFWPEYDIDTVQIASHPFETLTINGSSFTTSAQGTFSAEAGATANLSTLLRGPYVEVANEDDAEPVELSLALNTPFAPFNWDWEQGDAADAELNLYHHTMLIHEWYKVLDPDFNALDYPLPAVCNVGQSYDNAYWNGYGTYYGSGATYHDFAMFSDVIYHEYTHGVTDGIYPNGMLPYIDQPGAMNEAWSDYFASTINDDPLMADYINGSPSFSFRDLESNMVFPQNWVGEVHGDSPFISAPLWTIRQELGAQIADSIAHFARYALSETFFDYLIAVLEADDDDGDLSNGTPHASLIYDAFGDHGIGPGNEPHFALENLTYHADGQGQSIGDGDRFIEQGETAELTFTLQNAAPLFPPPANNVSITITTGDPNVVVTNGSQFVALLPAGTGFDLTPVLLQMQSSAPDHWVVLSIDVSSDGGQFTFHQSIEFTLGTPHLLIVEDDPASDVEHYVRNTIREQDKIYELAALNTGGSLPAEFYPNYGMVFWLSGNASGTVLTAQDRDWLTAFAQAGNKVVLSGQNIVDALDGSEFAQSILQVSVLPDTIPSHAVTGTADPFTPDDWFLTTGTGGAANQHEQSAFVPNDPGAQVFYYGRSGSGPVAGVSFANGNGLLVGFGMEAISGMSGSASRAQFMDRLYTWAGELLGDIDEQPTMSVPLEYGISSAYPNPFNSSASLTYSIPQGASGELFIYDVLGRVANQQVLSSASGTVHWSPEAATGIYFAQITWPGGQSKAVKLLQIR